MLFGLLYLHGFVLKWTPLRHRTLLAAADQKKKIKVEDITFNNSRLSLRFAKQWKSTTFLGILKANCYNNIYSIQEPLINIRIWHNAILCAQESETDIYIKTIIVDVDCDFQVLLQMIILLRVLQYTLLLCIHIQSIVNRHKCSNVHVCTCARMSVCVCTRSHTIFGSAV